MSNELIRLPMASDPPDEEKFFSKLVRMLARVPFAEDLAAAWYCAMDRDTPGYVRAVLLGAIAYFVMPFDVVPDILVGIGFGDDASVIAAAILALGRHITPAHRAAARARLETLTRR